MAKKRSPLTATQRALKNLNALIRRASKRGFYWYPEEVLSLRERVREGARYTPKEIYAKGIYVTPSGEVVSGTTGRTLEMRVAARKGAATKRKAAMKRKAAKDEAPEVALDIAEFRYRQLLELVSQIPDVVTKRGRVIEVRGYLRDDISNANEVMRRIVIDAVETEGLYEAMDRYEKNAEEINSIISWLHNYGLEADKAINGGFPKLAHLATLLKGSPLSAREAEEMYAFEYGAGVYYGSHTSS